MVAYSHLKVSPIAIRGVLFAYIKECFKQFPLMFWFIINLHGLPNFTYSSKFANCLQVVSLSFNGGISCSSYASLEEQVDKDFYFLIFWQYKEYKVFKLSGYLTTNHIWFSVVWISNLKKRVVSCYYGSISHFFTLLVYIRPYQKE